MTHLFLGDIAGLNRPLPAGEGSAAAHGALLRRPPPLVVGVGAISSPASSCTGWSRRRRAAAPTQRSRRIHDDAGHVGRRILIGKTARVVDRARRRRQRWPRRPQRPASGRLSQASRSAKRSAPSAEGLAHRSARSRLGAGIGAISVRPSAALILGGKPLYAAAISKIEVVRRLHRVGGSATRSPVRSLDLLLIFGPRPRPAVRASGDAPFRTSSSAYWRGSSRSAMRVFSPRASGTPFARCRSRAG